MINALKRKIECSPLEISDKSPRVEVLPPSSTVQEVADTVLNRRPNGATAPTLDAATDALIAALAAWQGLDDREQTNPA